MLSPEQVAQALSVPVQDVMQLVDSGELAAKRIGQSVRIRRADLEAFLSK
jgi:excisionase family DNA binding protein